MVYKQPRNLQHLAGGAKRGGNRRPRVADSGCPVMKETKEFRSSNSGKKYFIKKNVNCNISFVVNLAKCLYCQGQYVGKAETSFKKRNRKSDGRKED